MPIDYSALQTNEATKQTSGAIFSGDKGFVGSKESWEKKAVPAWPKSVVTAEEIEAQLIKIQNMSSAEAGEAEKPYQVALTILENAGQGVELKRENRKKTMGTGGSGGGGVGGGSLIVPEGYMRDGDKILVKVDVEKFKTEIGKLVSAVDQKWVKTAVIKQGSEQDFFQLVSQMLQVEESLTLIAVLASRLLINLEDKKIVDGHLSRVTVLQNRAGKLSQGVVRMGGFIGLACANDVPEVRHLCRFIVNPLLGQDVVDRPINQRAGETADDFNKRKAEHDRKFAAYKSVMTDMKNQRADFDKLSVIDKARIKEAVVNYLMS